MNTKNQKAIPSLLDSYRKLVYLTGDQAPAFKKSLLLAFISSIFQGLAFATIFPIFSCVLSTPFLGTSVWLWCALCLLLTLGDLFFRWWAHGFAYSWRMPAIIHELRVMLGNILREIPLESLYKKRTGELSVVLSNNVDLVVSPISNLCEMMIRSLVVPVVVIIATFFIHWGLAIALLVVFPLALPIYHSHRRQYQQLWQEIGEAAKQASADTLEYTQGLPVLRAANYVGEHANQLQKSLKNLENIQKKWQLKGLVPNAILWTLVEGGLMLILSLGVYFVLGGTVSIAALAALLIIIARISQPLALFTNVTKMLDLMEEGSSQIEELRQIPNINIEQPISSPENFDICFKDVDFSYVQSDSQELTKVSFVLPEKTLTALVGPSGAGKTTVIRLLSRYADPQKGQVCIGGVDIRHISTEKLMSMVSIVFQDVYLFDDTILANIRMGKPEATDEEVEAAATAAFCHEFINRLPEGYQTRIGDIGGTLSGGERQRISIARAILKDAPIVILDEPTAALDTESELAVQKSIDRLVQDRTVIVIAHRLSTIVAADQILVFDEGKLIQQGTHHELIDIQGRYQSMWQAQQRVKQWHVSN